MSDDHEMSRYTLEVLHDPDMNRLAIMQQWDDGESAYLILAIEDAEWLGRRLLAHVGKREIETSLN